MNSQGGVFKLLLWAVGGEEGAADSVGGRLGEELEASQLREYCAEQEQEQEQEEEEELQMESMQQEGDEDEEP